jgi:hypothetical protein
VLVTVDESGDPGMRLDRGSSLHFVIARVVMETTGDAERISVEIARLRRELRVKPEFKFGKCHPSIRDNFFAQTRSLPFRVRALVADKRRIHSPQLRTRKDYFYNHFVRMLFEHDNDRLQGGRAKIDGAGSHEFVRALKVYLRQQLSEGEIAKLSFADSRNDNLIQLADMVAGAIARSYREGSRDSPTRWRHMLRLRIKDIWEFT